MSVDLMFAVYNYFVWFLVVLFLTILFFRLKAGLSSKSDRNKIIQIEGNWFAKILKVLLGLAMLFAIPNIVYCTYIASAFKNIIPDYLNHLLAGSAILLALWEIYMTLTISKRLIDKNGRKILLTFLVVVLAPLSFLTVISLPEFFEFPDEEECLIIDFPVEGTWLAGNAGGNESINIHNFVRCQWYAIDMVELGENDKFFRNKGTELEDYYCFGSKVHSPVNGTVERVVDTMANTNVTTMPNERVAPAGNHVVIKVSEGKYIFLAHLNEGSIVVREGEILKTGDFIGTVGNSGNTSWPHLHLHLQDLPELDFKNAKGLPFRFREIERKRWMNFQRIQNAAITRNDLMRKVVD